MIISWLRVIFILKTDFEEVLNNFFRYKGEGFNKDNYIDISIPSAEDTRSREAENSEEPEEQEEVSLAFENPYSKIIWEGYRINVDSEWSVADEVTNLNGKGGRIAYNGSTFVSISGDGYTSTSSDGVIWAEAQSNANLGATNSYLGIAYGNNKFVILLLFIADFSLLLYRGRMFPPPT